MRASWLSFYLAIFLQQRWVGRITQSVATSRSIASGVVMEADLLRGGGFKSRVRTPTKQLISSCTEPSSATATRAPVRWTWTTWKLEFFFCFEGWTFLFEKNKKLYTYIQIQKKGFLSLSLFSFYPDLSRSRWTKGGFIIIKSGRHCLCAIQSALVLVGVVIRLTAEVVCLEKTLWTSKLQRRRRALPSTRAFMNVDPAIRGLKLIYSFVLDLLV